MRALLASLFLAPAAASQTPGLALTFEHGDATDTRVSRMVALRVEPGAVPTPFLAPGPFSATWRGQLEIALRDRYTFAFEGTGEVSVTVDGEQIPLGEPTRLRKGARALEVSYQSPASGVATARLLWSGSEFAPEPISPKLLSHDPNDADVIAGAQRRRGRAMLGRHQCTSCHLPPDAYELAADHLPELDRGAPDLTRVGTRLHPSWIAQWVLDPRGQRADATMPRLVKSERDAADLASYLTTLGEPAEAPLPASELDGEVLFAQLGCVGCHVPPGGAADSERISLARVGAKWRPTALVAFLRDPDAHWPGIGMPNLALSEAEAAALAKVVSAGSSPSAVPDGDAARGAELFARIGCRKCHQAPLVGVQRAPEWRGLKDLNAGCLAEQPSNAPDFAFDAGERDALRAAMPHVASLGVQVPAEAAARHFESLRCNACHDRDGVQSVWTTKQAEVAEWLGRAPRPKLSQARPDLTWTGEKLRADHVAALLAGAVTERARPWLVARMPSFAAHDMTMARGLAAQHGLPSDEPHTAVDPALAPLGQKLIGTDGGFSCILCHAVGEQPPLAVFEVQGVDFALTASRLRRDFFVRWMLDPLRVDPSSRMPKYADASGRTGFVDILEGDARVQFGAVWHYLSSLRGAK